MSITEDEIKVGSRRHVGALRLASMLCISVRTLSRWDAAGTGPPKIKLDRKVFFDLGKIPKWLANREISSAHVNTIKGVHRGQYQQ
jgi:hypothetical protein